MRRYLLYPLLFLLLLLAGPAALLLSGQIDLQTSWSNADRSSAQLAPDPARTPEAVVQVYAARAYNWRGAFAVHSWIATKAANASQYRVRQVTGWRRPTVIDRYDVPDRAWFGSQAQLLGELRGEAAARAITEIDRLLPGYPYADEYRAWPGPNSNTFVAWLLRRVPELQVALPSNALGKDYLGPQLLAATPSKSGYQLSLGGLLGATLAVQEGLELNVLGLVVGFDWQQRAIKLPGMGEVRLLQ
ncbi:DUF3750 domain-containing protein [Pokkaliibacter plantistimulans]|uniref:DUF3750 domain-containing protein n=1 Tax=Proteobacteria bacterium 228 TaxID=2083153 RepID=A0A2S5KPL8_9PROT|nr:DUF3750 domain-containing protein [Pokkaliibacter plantistimulans]PPC76236.1 DUF3750 domain-containing protein [Pokkaliibacter plantistimulans]